MTVLKKIASVLLGMLSGFACMVIFESLASWLHPKPLNFKIENKEALIEYINNTPFISMLLVALGWCAAAFIAGLTGPIIHKQKNYLPSLICASIYMFLTGFNLITFPHPIWMWVIGLCCWFPLAWLGFKTYLKYFFNQPNN